MKSPTPANPKVIANLVKSAAAQRTLIRGVHMTFAAPSVIELLHVADIQFIYLDGEHGRFDWRDIETACVAAERHGMTPIARIPDINTSTITRFLDRGIKGIVAPHIETLEAARRVVNACYFGPDGGRSFGAGRPEYGQGIEDLHQYMRDCNDAVSVCLMIESQAGLDIAGELASIRGVDYLSFGMNDLAQDMGYPGEPDHPQVLEAVAKASRQIEAAGKPVRESFMRFAWLNQLILAGTRSLLAD